MPHASVAVAVPSAASICEDDGLQLCNAGAVAKERVGGVTSMVQFTVLERVEVLPQPSVAVHVLVSDAEHPLVITDPSLNVTVGVPHASLAVAVPSAASI